ncbi:MAG: histidinol-phosphate transaminase [Lachnospiraceae bacterium]|nr:histidinol-phosphate transaminase [Lachnospiraceae bacterium]
MSWENNVRRVTPYVPGEQPKRKDIIKLNTNENPYPPAPAVQQVLREFSVDTLRKYPDPTVGALTKALSENYCVPEDQIFVGVGSDDVLAMSFMTFFHGDKPILFPDITYSFYDVWAEEFEIPYETKPLREDFTICRDDYMCENGGIVIPNPNAPTGIEARRDELEMIIASNPDSVVIIDEAYVDFGAETTLPLIEKYDNLLVVMTFSKSRSLAGSRIGFAMGSKKLIGYLQDVKYSFNSYTMDSVTSAIGCAALSDPKYFLETCEKIVETREWTKKELHALGFSFPDSRTNFIFAKHECWDAARLFEDLKEAGIYVRYFNKPRIDQYLRISIGTMEEMQQLVAFLQDYKQV